MTQTKTRTEPVREPCCGNCRYWDRRGAARGYSSSEAIDADGYATHYDGVRVRTSAHCRRRAPAADQGFSTVTNAEWCGDYAPHEAAGVESVCRLLALAVLVDGDLTAGRALADRLINLEGEA